MKQRRIVLPLLCSILISSSGLSAGPYVQGFLQWMDTNYDNSTGLGARLGFAFDELNSLEFEYGYTDLNSIDTVLILDGSDTDVRGTANLNILMANYRFTYPFSERFRVLAGAGIGATIGSIDVTTDSGTDDGTNAVFTYQFFAGAEYFILPRLSVHGAFRLMQFDDFTYSDDNVRVTVDAGDAKILETGVSFYF
ncbi:MAG: outer membrane protein [Puniceicoccaceae bacterium]